jgi:hypothetical protein
MRGRKRRRAEKRRLEEEAFDGYDNFDLVDTSERLPSDYWALREAQEEYCKEYGC